jgi:hypothetical protein
LSCAEIESAISSIPNGNVFLGNSQIRQHVYYFGGVPRWTVEYISSLNSTLERNEIQGDFSKLSYNNIENAFNFTRSNYSSLWNERLVLRHGLDCSDTTVIAAYSLCGKAVNMNDKINGKVTWSKLRDNSGLLIDDLNRVVVPLELYRNLSYRFISHTESKEIYCLISTLQSFFEKVDTFVYQKAPAQLWQAFGAHYHALRINSFLILGINEIKISELFNGSVICGCNEKVFLKPMQVMETSDIYNEEIGAVISEKKNNYRRNWIEDGWIVINGESGKGVDLFFSLKRCKLNSGYVVVTDQRNYSYGNMDQMNLCDLVEKSKILPKLCEESINISCIFSHFSPQMNHDYLPYNICFVSNSESRDYHGSLWFHPAASPNINVNNAPLSSLKMLFKGKDTEEFCQEILSTRAKRAILDVNEVEEILKKSKKDVHLKEEFTHCIEF